MYIKRIFAFLLILTMYLCTTSCVNTDDYSNDSTDTEPSHITDSISDGSNSEISDGSSADIACSEDSTSEDKNVEKSDAETSEDVVIDRFSVLSPDVIYNKVWENGEIELHNTDFRMSDALADKFADRFASFDKAQSVALIELDTNMAFCYSKDTKIGTASAIKGPMALFTYKCVDDGLYTWNTKKTYQKWHFQENSTGWVQRSPYGTDFSLKTLIDYMIRISDNQAYLMIKELVGAENFENMMSKLGSSRIIPKGGNWGDITAWEMAAVWREIYYYSQYNENGAELLDRFMHAQYNYIWRAIPQYEAAHKSGWSGRAFNDAGIVYADGHEYVLVVLMGRNGIDDDSSHYQFNAVTRLLAELMVEYNAYIEADADLRE